MVVVVAAAVVVVLVVEVEEEEEVAVVVVVVAAAAAAAAAAVVAVVVVVEEEDSSFPSMSIQSSYRSVCCFRSIHLYAFQQPSESPSVKQTDVHERKTCQGESSSPRGLCVAIASMC